MSDGILIRDRSEIVGKLVNAIEFSGDWPEYGYTVTIKRVKGKRTDAQNNALHMYFRMLAGEWNGAGLTQQVVFEALEHGAKVTWSDGSVKCFWKQLQMQIVGHDKTSGLDTHEIDQVLVPLKEIFLRPKLNFVLPPFPSEYGRSLESG